MTGLEETFRAVLAARLPDDPKWAAWIDGTVTELMASAVVLTPEEAELAAPALRNAAARHATAPGGAWHELAAQLRLLATRLEATR